MNLPLGVALLSAVAAQAQPQMPLGVPSSPWIVSFEASGCVASRNFKLNGEEVVLGLEPSPTGGDYGLYFQKAGVLKGYDMADASVFVGGTKTEVKRFFAEPVVRPGFVKYGTSIEDAQYRALLGGAELSVSSKPVNGRLGLGKLSVVDRALKECVATRLEHWGFSRDQQARVASYPERLNEDKPLFTPDDYPERAIDKNSIGLVEAVLSIDPEGRVASCQFVRGSGHKDLDNRTCSMIKKRARFTPALDRDGRPMVAPVFFSVRWLLS